MVVVTGRHLRVARKRRHMRQEDVAKMVGCNRTWIIRLEKATDAAIAEKMVGKLNKAVGGDAWQKEADKEITKGGYDHAAIEKLIEQVEQLELRVHVLERLGRLTGGLTKARKN